MSCHRSRLRCVALAITVLVASAAPIAPFGRVAPARAGDAGERLVAPEAPSDAEWLLAADPSRPATRLWKRRANEREHLRIELLPGSAEGLAAIRGTLDAPGKAGCAVFDTTTIRDSPLNGYARLLWRTDCERADGSRSTLLNLAVRGREHLYLALRSWPVHAPEAEIAPWIERFERFLVCDDRSPRQACPEGLVPLAPQ